MNRRVFILTGGGVLTAQTLPSRQVVVGLIGAGARGMELLQTCLEEPSVRIGAVCETYEPRMFGAVALARSKGHRTRYYRIYHDLIADTDLDAVLIATPDFWHHRMTLDALQTGKDVYLEQPLSLTWQEGVELAKSELESRRIIQVGSQRRSSRFLVQIAQKPPGRVRTVRVRRSSSYLRKGVLRRGGFKLRDPLNFADWQKVARTQVPYSPDRFLNWRFYSMYGGGIVTDLGCDVLDGIHMLTGTGFALSVKASGVRSPEPGFDTVQHASISVEYPGGQTATLLLDGAAQSPRERWILEGAGSRINIGTEATASGEVADATRRHLANFFECVRSRTSPNAPIGKTFPATLICQMANLSIAAGRPAVWDAARSQVEI
jgi:predicted dehydrogenase